MVGFVFVGNIEFCPYFLNYRKIAEELGIEYKVFYWDRAKLQSNFGENFVAFQYESKLVQNKFKKALDFYRYYKWINKQIDIYKINRIVALETLSAFLIRYKLGTKNYILEIRDYSYERNIFFSRLEKKIISDSYCTFISSPAFKAFLPCGLEYTLVHNISLDDNSVGRIGVKSKKRLEKGPLNIVWAGSIRYFKAQVGVISQLKNDDRFAIYYHGSGHELERMEAYCKYNDVKNVVFTGRYEESEKVNFYKDADFILNAYDTTIGPEVKYALSNRFYDSILLGIPQIVESGSYKAKIVEKYNIGVCAGPNLKERILKYYDEYDREIFNQISARLVKKCLNDNNKMVELIKDFMVKDL